MRRSMASRGWRKGLVRAKRRSLLLLSAPCGYNAAEAEAKVDEKNPVTTLEDARRVMAGRPCWVLTDGKAGDEEQCVGVAERLGLEPERRRVSPRPPFSWLPAFAPIARTDRPEQPGSPLAPPFPMRGLVIASGRRVVPHLRHLRRVWGAGPDAPFTVFLKDPRLDGAADLVWVPSHDRRRGDDVIVTMTSPHRLSPERLAAARAAPVAALASLGRPLVAVLLGGDSRHHRFVAADVERLAGLLGAIAAQGATLAVTASRRTPPVLATRIAALARAANGYVWDGTGENPLPGLLALADHLVVTADSINMLGEAAATGSPILAFEPSGGSRKTRMFLQALRDHGAVRMLGPTLERFRYPPLDATPEIAVAIARRFASRRDTT